MKAKAWGVCCLFLLLSLPGCGSLGGDWFSAGGIFGPRVKPHLVDPIAARRLGYSIQWATQVPAVGSGEQVLTILDDVAVVLEKPDNIATVISLKDGSTRWTKTVAHHLEHVISMDRWKNLLLVTTESAIIHYDLADGKMLIRQRLSEIVANGPAVVEEYAIFGGTSGLVFGHDLVTGAPAWKYQLSGPVTTRPVDLGSQRVLVATLTGRWQALSALKGRPLWGGRALGNITANPVVNNLGAYVTSEDHNIYAVGKGDGLPRENWPYRTQVPLRQTPVVLDRYLFVNVPEVGLVAIDTGRNSPMWTLKDAGDPLLLSDQKLLFHEDQQLVLRDLRKSLVLEQIQIQPVKHVRAAGQQLVLMNEQGRILCLAPIRTSGPATAAAN